MTSIVKCYKNQIQEEYKIFYLELDRRLKVQSNMKLHAVKSNAVLRKVYVLFTPTTIVYDRDWHFDNLIAWD
jgi:hypothetical protein